MARGWIAGLLLALAALAPVWGQGTGNGVALRLASPPLQSVPPGKLLSISVRVTSAMAQPCDLSEALDPPEGWRIVMPPAPFHLEPGETATRLTACLIPQSAPAGRYTVRYAVRNERDPSVQETVSMDVDVLPVSRLALVVEDKPDYVIAGTEVALSVRLVNQGNAPIRVALKADGPAPGKATVAPSDVTVPAGASALVRVTDPTDGSARKAFTHYVQVAAVTSDGKTEAALTVGVDAIPQARGRESLQHTLSTQLDMGYAANDATDPLQVAWRGAGSLDESGERVIDFAIQRSRAPAAGAYGLFGWRSDVYLDYATPKGRIHLGDQVFGLSTLTDFLHYGRGLEVRAGRDDAMSAGGYYMTGEWASPGLHAGGLYVQRALGPETKLRLNLLSGEQYSYRDGKDVRARLASLEAALQPTKQMGVQLEYGRSDSPDTLNRAASAYRLEVNGVFGRGARYSLRKVHADPDYTGYYRDTDQATGALSVPFGRRLSANASWASWSQNLALRSNLPAPRERLVQGGLQWAFARDWYASVGATDFARRDALPPADFDARERTLQATLGHSASRFNWNLELQQGTEDNHIEKRRDRVRDASLFASWNTGRNSYLSLYGGRRTGSVDGHLLGNSNYFGFSGSVRPSPRLSATANWSTYAASEGYPAVNVGQLGIRCALPNGYLVSFRVLHSSAGSSYRMTSTLLTYTVPLELPVGPKKSVGLVRGRLFDARAPGRPGIARATLVLNGMAVLTDADGAFEFPALKPGAYTLVVDRKSIGLNRIVERKSPIPVEVTGGKTATLDLGVVEAASVSGQVRIAAPPATASGDRYVVGGPDGTSPEQGLENILVELSNGEEVLRRLTDKDGRFLFDALRPGPWHMKVYGENLPAYHALERPEQDLDLGAQLHAQVEILVRPQVRKIKFQSGF